MSETIIATLSVPTIGQARVDSISVAPQNSGVVNVVDTLSMTNLGTLGTGTLYEVSIPMPQYNNFTTLNLIGDVTYSIEVSYSITNYLTFMISLDGINFKGYNNGAWESNYKMTEAEMESITPLQWKELASRIYQNTLKVKSEIINNHAIVKVVLGTINVNFASNQAPIITASSITPDTVSLNAATVVVDYEDMEGDTVSYKISVQKSGDSTYTQIFPTEGWQSTSIAGRLSQDINYSSLAVGLNNVKVELKDQRDLVSEFTGNITMTNTNPYLVYSHTGFTVQGTINDADGDAVSVQVLINGVLKHDYHDFTVFTSSPKGFYFEWEAVDLNLNVMNDITLNIKDNRGGTSTETFQVLGRYKGILFADILGEYYTTDVGELLQLLDLGVIVAGQNTEPVKINLYNSTGYTIENILIYSNETNLPTNAHVKLSFSNEPFVAQDSLIIIDAISDGIGRDFYMQIQTDPGRGKLNSEFSLLTTATATT